MAAIPGRFELLLVNEMSTAVLLPASFVAFAAERFFLAVADRLDAAGCDSGGGQRVLHGCRTLVAQGQVIFGRSAFVAVSLDRDIDRGMLVQKQHVRLNRALLVGAHAGLIVVEVNVLYVLREQFFFRRPA